MSDAAEERAATAAEAKAGVDFRAGHAVRLVISDGHGRPPYRREPVGRAIDNPRWTDLEHFHGGTAEMLADATGAEGAAVVFSVEVFHGGAWSKVKDVAATVAGGTARATVPMEHPAADDAGASAAHVRFSVRFAAGPP